MTVTPRRRPLRWAAFLVALTTLAAPTAAHELENTHVLIAFLADGGYQIDIMNHADWTWMRMHPDAEGLPLPRARDRDLTGLVDRFADGIQVVFDGERVEPAEVVYLPPFEETAGTIFEEPGVMRLTGTAPDGARTFQFAYELVEEALPADDQPGPG